MYAVIKTGGKQYRIEEGDSILIDRIEGDKKRKIKFDEVLLIKDNGKLITEVKDLSKAVVVGSVLEQLKGEKVIVFKYKPKKNYRRKKGHRSLLTKVRIEEISYEGKKKKVEKVKKEKPLPKPKAAKEEIKPLKAKEVRKPEKKEEKGKPAEAEVKGSVGLYARRKKKEEEPKKQAKKEKPEKKESKLRKRISRKKSEEKIKPKEKTTKARKKESTKK